MHLFARFYRSVMTLSFLSNRYELEAMEARASECVAMIYSTAPVMLRIALIINKIDQM